MRLGVFTDYTYRRAGERVYAERAFALFVGRLADEVDELVVIGKVSRDDGPLRYALPSAVRFVELPYYRSLVAPREAVPAILGSARAFWRMLDGVDAVWLLGPHPQALLFAAIAIARRRPVVLGVRQDFPRYVRARNPGRRWTHRTADLIELLWRRIARGRGVVAVGPALAGNYPGADVLEIAVSLVQESDLAAPGVLAARDYSAEELIILSVGRLEEEKNPLLLADILRRVRDDGTRWRLIVCGEGPLSADLARRCRQLGVADGIELRGYVAQGSQLRDLYRASHVLLHVSWTEGLPQVLLEAFAARLPVVATAVGGVAAAAGDAALLVPPGDVEAATAALRRVAADAELRSTLTESGILRVRCRTLEREAARVAGFIAARVHAAGSAPR